ncbi:MAG: S-adenosyl-l-methionine hydroxide adenosyltransferase family protein [Dehalococcoidia bacterium]
MSPSRPVITLTTDFGSTDPYVGVMKGVVLGINPEASLVDITHQIEPQNILQGAFLLGKGYHFFPPHTIHLVVVDPGVGSSRRPIILETPGGRFVGPDNGVLSYVLTDGGAQPLMGKADQVGLPREWRAYHLTNPDYWLHPLSSTFHGRDLFAPVAGHLSLGVSPQEMGEEVDSLTCLPVDAPTWEDDRLRGRVVHVDRFGNLITDLPSSLLDEAPQLKVDVGGSRIRGLSASYAQGEGLLALIGSYDTLEVALKNGSAAAELGAHIGDAVLVTSLADG